MIYTVYIFCALKCHTCVYKYLCMLKLNLQTKGVEQGRIRTQIQNFPWKIQEPLGKNHGGRNSTEHDKIFFLLTVEL